MGFPDFTPAADCVSCGLCLPHCPTYRELPSEAASPRGRIQIIKGLVDGSIDAGSDAAEHLDLCLACRACESACPSGVRFGTLIESARALLNSKAAGWSLGGALDRFFMRRIFPFPSRLAAIGIALRAYQASGLQRVLRGTGFTAFLPARLRQLEAMTPTASALTEMFGGREEAPAYGVERGRVGFVTGCVMPLLMARTNKASVDVLRWNGFTVVSPVAQRCCGALHLHNGHLNDARELARRNVAAFDAAGVEAVLSNAAGCGSALKEYGKLLDDDGAWAGRARDFSGKMRDIQEFLGERGLRAPAGSIRARAVFDDPCHLLHGQRVKRQPRDLLRAIPGLSLAEAKEADWCCGSAGIYTLTHTEMSLAILDRKMEDLLAVRPDVILTANPGCLLQLRLGVRRAGRKVPVLHVMDLLAAAYGGGGEIPEEENG